MKGVSGLVDVVWTVMKYGLLLFLGGGLYAAILLRFTGRTGRASDLAVLSWLPVFAAIVYFWRPFG